MFMKSIWLCAKPAEQTVWRASWRGWCWRGLKEWGRDCSTDRCRRRRTGNPGHNHHKYHGSLQHIPQTPGVQSSHNQYRMSLLLLQQSNSLLMAQCGGGLGSYHWYKWPVVQWLREWPSELQQKGNRLSLRCFDQWWSSVHLSRRNKVSQGRHILLFCTADFSVRNMTFTVRGR